MLVTDLLDVFLAPIKPNRLTNSVFMQQPVDSHGRDTDWSRQPSHRSCRGSWLGHVIVSCESELLIDHPESVLHFRADVGLGDFDQIIHRPLLLAAYPVSPDLRSQNNVPRMALIFQNLPKGGSIGCLCHHNRGCLIAWDLGGRKVPKGVPNEQSLEIRSH